MQTFADVFKVLDQGAADAFKTAKTTATSNLSGVLYESLSGNMDKARDLLGNFGTEMDKSFEGFGEKMAKSLTKELTDGLANIAQGITIDPLLDLLGFDFGKGSNALSTLTGTGAKTTGLLNTGGTGLISQLLLGGGKTASGGFFEALSAGASFSEALDFAGITGQGGIMDAAISSVSSIFGGGTAGTAAAGAGAATAGAAGWTGSFAADMGAEFAAMGAEGSSSLLGSGFMSSALPALGVVAMPEIMSQIFGTPGPMEVIGDIFSGEGGHTQESALAYVKADMEYLVRATQDVQQALENTALGAEKFGAGMLTSMSPATQEMQRLADLAGLGNDGLAAMVDALDPLQAKWVEASSVLGLAEDELGRMGSVLSDNNEFLFGGISQTEAYSGRVAQLAEALKLPEAATASLIKTSDGLLAQWKAGEIGAEQVGATLKEAFAQALAQVANDGAVTTEHMRALAEAIRAIPAEWTSVVNVVYRQQGDAPVLHWGGRVMHSGGWIGDLPRFHSGAQVTSLAQDEVPIIARRGEYVVRAESVSAASLPWLAALNQTGRVPEAAAGLPAVNLHVEVHGNFLGGEDNLEELARIMERKLRDLQAGRWAA